ncbi:ubiquinone/menaquinone biosynthesis methyltransferase [Staphylococcus gallinarum]|uniref:Demethylmenaquinone methyltransferase n=1 Tax=Staphylococcus gallinarum TaxID=1293 RepID=A0A380FI22_STAGA|nr:ubiquinone/menaquinone biosynthesis methyltransferase [Staphylococcus gallinarum]
MADNKVNKEKVHNVFQNISGKYDRLNNIISFEQHKTWRKHVMKEMKVKPGSKALDVCCGTADWTISLSKAVGPTGEVTGVDFSENMLEVGKTKTQDMDNINLVHGDAMNLPFEDNEFDYVTIGFGLRNVPDYLATLKELNRVLKPGGNGSVSRDKPTYNTWIHTVILNFTLNLSCLFLVKFLLKSKEEYEWLQQSTFDFPDKEKLKRLFSQAGFSNIKVRSFTGGVAAMHLGYK